MSKNTRNRILLTALAALLLVVVAVGGTMAWLVDTTDEVKNTFTPSEIDIDLTEEKPTGQTAKMIPGATIEKNPVVTVKSGSEASWVFVVITKSTNADYDTYLKDYDVASGWTRFDTTTKADAAAKAEGETYETVEVFYQPVAATNSDTTLKILNPESITVKTSVTNQEMDALNTNNYPTLTFKAYAIQQSSFSVGDAWTEASKTDPAYPEYKTGADTQ